MATTLVGDRPRSVLAEATAPADELLLFTPSETIIADTISFLTDHEPQTQAQLVSHETVLDTVLNDFVLASRIADLQAADTLSLRQTDRMVVNSLLVADDNVTAVVDGPGRCVGLRGTSLPVVKNARLRHQQYWNGGTPAQPQTPPLSDLEATMRTQLGESVAEDFTTIVQAAETATPARSALDGVTISLLAAANNDTLLYDLNRWGEDVGLASKATFSRTKTRLTDAGLVETEKVPIDIGRPRLRLCRDPDQPAEPVAFAEQARDRLTESH